MMRVSLLLIHILSGVTCLVDLCAEKAVLETPDVNFIWPPIQLSNASNLIEIRVSILLPATFKHDTALQNHGKQRNATARNIKLLPEMKRTVPAILAGLEESISRGLVPNLYFNLTLRDTKCSSDGLHAAKSWIDATESGVDLLLGPSCEYCLAVSARLNKLAKVPQVTAGGFSFDFQKNKTKFEDEFYLLTKTGYNFWDAATTIYKFMEEAAWKRIVLVYRKNDLSEWSGHGTCTMFMSAMVQFVKNNNNIDPPKMIDLDVQPYNSTEEMLRGRLPELNNSIIAMCASQQNVRDIMISADKLGLIDGGQYAFFNVDLFNNNLTNYKPWYIEGREEDNAAARRAFQAVLTISGDANAIEGIAERVKEIAKEKFDFEYDMPVNSFMAQFYDGVLLYATALNETLEELGESGVKDGHLFLDGCKITEKMWNRTFHGVTGQVRINENGNRINKYTILDMDPQTDLFRIVRIYDTVNKTLLNVSKIHWPGKTGKPPLDWPECGFDGSLCIPKPKNILLLVLSVVTTCLMVILALVAVVTYRHYKIEADIARMYWKIDPQDILPTKIGGGKFGSALSLNRMGREPDLYSIDSMGCAETKNQVYVKTGYYKGTVVAIKKIGCSNINLNRGLLLDLKRMKDLNCSHIVRFVGACLDCDDPILVTEYCPRGSLQDILEDEAMELDWNFRYSLIHDIINGMGFLHSSEIGIHGNMKSSNCVVDGRFVLKLTDFGLHELRQESEALDKNSYEYWKRKLWTSPELLRDTNNQWGGTQKGDIYAFSIILHEIVVRNGTWGLDQSYRSPEEIIESIIEGVGEVRPDVDKDATDKDIVDVMKQCWAENQLERPDAASLKYTLKKLNKQGASSNILDNLLSRMEQYANNLESLVEERTSDYLEEKRKCEDLLYELLPKAVASRLIEGQDVAAESFSSVTIFFSDIVGFTALSAGSSAIQIIDFLNDLYTCFDSIIENFDVYKVETIGDAYMIVSGLPIRNGVIHAREIARTALRILEAVKTFKIRHRPKDKLKLRIGMHTGPCCAGVVGIKMPRYCLFGDTVNTASRMESNGLPRKIHVSQKTVDLLETFDTFEIEYRGEVEMKGKGVMKTYWLLGEKEEYSGRNMRDQQGIENSSFEVGEDMGRITDNTTHLKNMEGQNYNSLGTNGVQQGNENSAEHYQMYNNSPGVHQGDEHSTEQYKMYNNIGLGPTPDLIQAHSCAIQIHDNPMHTPNIQNANNHQEVQLQESQVQPNMIPSKHRLTWDSSQPTNNTSTQLQRNTLSLETSTENDETVGTPLYTRITDERPPGNTAYEGTPLYTKIPDQTPPRNMAYEGTPLYTRMADSNTPLMDMSNCNYSVL